MSNAGILITQDIIDQIHLNLQLAKNGIKSVLELLLDDCTIPFIARYRKEVTGSLDEVQIRDIRDTFETICALNERRDTVIRSIEEQGKLTPELKEKILACTTKTQLEDLYLPYKPKKRTKGQIAKEKGLEPLAIALFSQEISDSNPIAIATPYVASCQLSSVEEALQGAHDIVAEMISETPEVRGELRQWIYDNGSFKSQAMPEFQEKKTKFNNYYNFSEPVKTIAPHRLMALRRGEKENILKVNLVFEEDAAKSLIVNSVIKPTTSTECSQFLFKAIEDSFKRLLSPSIETELRLETKSRSEEDAIRVFSTNLKALLLLPPIPKSVVMAVDPGLRTGSKLVVLNSTGKLEEYSTIFPDHNQPVQSPKNQNASEIVKNLVERHKVGYIAIGNGTAGREMESFIEKCLENYGLKCRLVMVNESGASVYSASDVAREEFPQLDISYRGAVSIGRRLQDPLAELVKIDPKSIGVGQYQHDVNQTRLKKSLEETVESCVNYVGVQLNTASPSLLSYVAGIGPSLAKGIVKYREDNGAFASRDDLKKIPGFGPKTFQQAAGFLRIPGSPDPLDNTAVHPESYTVVEKMAHSLNLATKDIFGKKDLLKQLDLTQFVTENVGLPTLKDILSELFKPGRDPRSDGVKHTYNKDVRDLEKLEEGQVVDGTVTNVTNFGAFVDIGVHQDGLIHISELSHQFIKDPNQAISVGQHVKVKVIGLDKERKRISLSKKALEPAPSGAHVPTSPSPRRDGGGSREGAHTQQGPRKPFSPRPPARPQDKEMKNKGPSSRKEEPQNTATFQDLLSKFNSHRV